MTLQQKSNNDRATYVKNDVAEDADEDTLEIPQEMSEEMANKLESAATANWGVFLSGKGVCHVPRCGEGEAEGPIEVEHFTLWKYRDEI